MVNTAINLYTVRDLDQSLLSILDRVGDAGYDGVQFAGDLGDATPEAVAAKLSEHDLTPIAPHIGISKLEDDQAGVLAVFRDALGCDDVVLPYLDPSHFVDADSVDAMSTRIREIADRLPADVRLHYHNHDFEFTQLGEQTAFDRLLENTPSTIGIELDVGWALAGGADPAPLIERLGDRIEYLHMKDVDCAGSENTPVEIGTGDVDMGACADAATAVGATWLIYEHDHPVDPAASISTGARFLPTL